MRLERTHDMEIVEEVINHPMIVSRLTDSQDWNTIWDDGTTHFMLVLNNEEEVVGLYIVVQFNMWTWNVHSMFLPEAYKFGTLRAAKLLKEYIFEDLEALKIITQVPSYNDLAKGYAQNTGMTYEGTIVKAFKKGETMYDILMYGLTKEQYDASTSVDRSSSSGSIS